MKERLKAALDDALHRQVSKLFDVRMGASADDEEATMRFVTGLNKALMIYAELVNVVDERQ